MHTHLTKFAGPVICRTRGKISGSHFVAVLLIAPRSYDYVDDIMCMIHLLCIHIWQSSKVLALAESEIQHVVLILRLLCTQVAWPDWWRYVSNSFIIHIHLIQLEDRSTYWTCDTTSGLHFISSLQIVFKSCDCRDFTTSDVICVLPRLCDSQVIKNVVQLFSCAPKLHEGLCFNLNKTIVMIKRYGL